MTRTVSLALVILLAGEVSAAKPTDQDGVVGTWRMVAVRNGDSPEYQRVADNRRVLKIVTERRFVKVDVVDGMIQRSASGTCALFRGTEDDRYAETVQDVSSEGARWFVGQEQVYKSRIDGDQWRIEGELRGSGRTFKIDEIWRRVRD